MIEWTRALHWYTYVFFALDRQDLEEYNNEETSSQRIEEKLDRATRKCVFVWLGFINNYNQIYISRVIYIFLYCVIRYNIYSQSITPTALYN